jgi:putative peptidoglycan lipid II flippase
MVKGALTVGSLTGVSRLLGFVRDLMIAAVLGAGAAADAFFVSFKLANLLRRLFAEGAFNAAFVPLFARAHEGEGAEAARRFAEEALAVMTTVLLVVVLLAQLAMPWLVRVLAPGFEVTGERYGLAVELSRITFPYLMFISLAALFSGVLNSIGRFAAAAFAPIILNLVLITTLLLASLHPATPAHQLAWGVFVAGILQLVWVALAARRNGMGLRLRVPRVTARLKRLFRLMLPGAVGSGVYQINLVIDTLFASTLPVGAVSYLFYADRLNQLPLGIIGVAIGTVILPLLARQLRAGQDGSASHTQNRALEMGLLLTLPAAAALIVLASPIIGVLFERGAFGPDDTAATASALMAFSLGLPAYVLIKVLVPAFFAREDTATPVKVAAVCLLANVALILALIGPLAHVGIALATALSNALNVTLLAVILHRRGHLRLDARFRRTVPRIVLATAGMTAALFAAHRLLATPEPALDLALTIAIGGAVYLALAVVLGAADVADLKRQLARRRAPAGPGAGSSA